MENFYAKNKYLIKSLIAIIVFSIAVFPLYFLYVKYANYDAKVINDLKQLSVNINTSKSELEAKQKRVDDKKSELEMIKNEKNEILQMLNKYPEEDRYTTIFNSELFLMNITQDLNVILLEARENELIPGEIEQIPFVLECKSTYPEMINLLDTINERKFLYLKDINVRLDGALLNYKINLIALGKKTEEVDIPVIDPITPVEPEEIKVVMRTNPFGTSMSSVEDNSHGPIGPSDDVNNDNSGNNDIDYNIDYIASYDKLYPLDDDATLIQDYKEGRNVINNNLTNFSHCISLGTKLGAKVRNVKDGKVIFVGKFGSNGTSVMIEHKNGDISYYGNLKGITVVKGQNVKQGYIIGYVAGAGDLKVPHLKFGYAIDNQFVDPKQFMDIVTESQLTEEAYEPTQEEDDIF